MVARDTCLWVHLLRKWGDPKAKMKITDEVKKLIRLLQGGRTYVMITYVSKENNLGTDDKIRYIWGLKGPIFIL